MNFAHLTSFQAISLRAGSLVGRVSWAKELARRMGRGKVLFLASFFSPVLGSLSSTQTSEPARRLSSHRIHCLARSENAGHFCMSDK